MKNSLLKIYTYGNASREKTFKVARLKMFEVIDKSLSELLKKNAKSKEGLVLELHLF
jgi:hypothetical protein